MTIRHFSAVALLVCTIPAYADLIMEQTIEGPDQKDTMTVYIKGEKFRSDVGKEMSSIRNVTTGDQISLLHTDKTSTTLTGAQARQSAELIKKLTAQFGDGGKPAEPKPKVIDTGKREKIGEYECVLYSFTYGGSKTTLWAAKDYPNYQAYKAELDVLNKTDDQLVDMSLVDGMIIKSETGEGPTKSVTTLISLKQAPVDAAIFSIPKDYKVVDPGR